MCSAQDELALFEAAERLVRDRCVCWAPRRPPHQSPWPAMQMHALFLVVAVDLVVYSTSMHDMCTGYIYVRAL